MTWDALFWWVGVVVVAAGGLALTALIFCAVVLAVWMSVRYYGERAWALSQNIPALFAWMRAGRPVFRLLDDGTYGWIATAPILDADDK